MSRAGGKRWRWGRRRWRSINECRRGKQGDIIREISQGKEIKQIDRISDNVAQVKRHPTNLERHARLQLLENKIIGHGAGRNNILINNNEKSFLDRYPFFLTNKEGNW